MPWDMCRPLLRITLAAVRCAPLLAILAVAVRPAAPADGEAMDLVALLRQADRARGNSSGVTWEVTVESRQGERRRDLVVAVQSRGYDFRGEILAPPKQKGQTLLMVSGNMWFHKPGLSKPVPISRRQRLMGEAAHGDIAATNYAEEFEPTVMGEETVDGERCVVLDLKAVDKKATYDRIHYWVSRERGVGVRAEYFTVSGKVIKTSVMEYAQTVAVDGTPRPFISRLVITDALLSDNVTTLTFRKPRFGELPDHVFNLNLIGR
jgi:hypothetical protein